MRNTVRSLDEIKKILTQHQKELRQNYNLKQIGVFGSYSRNEQKKGSDIDILVEFVEPVGLLKFLELEENLCFLLGEKVDLVTRGALKPYIGEHILKEVVYL